MPFIEPFNDTPTLSDEQCHTFLDRIGLKFAEVGCETNLSNLSRIVQAGCLIPFDTTRYHLTEGREDDVQLELRQGPKPTLDLSVIFDIVVVQRRGATCSWTNLLLAACLRSLGYEIDLAVARPSDNLNMPGEDPVYYHAMHTVVLTRLDGGIYLCDSSIVTGGVMPPLLLIAAEGPVSDQKGGVFTTVHERVPGVPKTFLNDLTRGWSIYRQSSSRESDGAPQRALYYHVHLHQQTLADMISVECSLTACGGHGNRFFVNQVNADGRRRIMHYLEGNDFVRIYERELAGQIVRDACIPATYRAVRQAMRDEFGYKI